MEEEGDKTKKETEDEELAGLSACFGVAWLAQQLPPTHTLTHPQPNGETRNTKQYFVDDSRLLFAVGVAWDKRGGGEMEALVLALFLSCFSLFSLSLSSLPSSFFLFLLVHHFSCGPANWREQEEKYKQEEAGKERKRGAISHRWEIALPSLCHINREGGKGKHGGFFFSSHKHGWGVAAACIERKCMGLGEGGMDGWMDG